MRSRRASVAPLVDRGSEEALAVLHRGFGAGILRASPQGLSFAYDPRWLASPRAFPLSLTMPLSHDVWPDAIVGPWIANLLPEEGMLRAFAQALGVSAADAFAVLARAGADVAGAFSFALLGSQPTVEAGHRSIEDYVAAGASVDVSARAADAPKAVPEAAAEAAAEAALASLIDGLANRPFFADDAGVRISLAGGQVKTALTGLDASGWPTTSTTPARLVVPVGAAASTLILKPDNPRLLGIVEIEAYGLELARRIGLDAALWRILRVGSRSALLVARYDREILPRGGRVDEPALAVRRIHQEDFCQLLGLEPWRKYEHATGGGASMADLFAAARRWLPPRDLLRFRDYVIYNILVGNTDAHAKNYSVIVRADGARLAPLYDVCSSLAWRTVYRKHAQKIAGALRKPVDVRRRHWEGVAAGCGLNARETLRRVDEMAAAMVAAMAGARDAVAGQPGAVGAVVDDIAARIDENALRIQGGL